MDKLFSRKRSASIAARHKEQHDRAKGRDKDAPEKPAATLKKAATTGGNKGEALSEKQAGKRKEAVDAAFGVGDGGGSTRRPERVGDKAPSLDVDIRTSLILPGLSQRFSVLLPQLSSAPETSLRSLLASQRERSEGPSLTLEEEEMLFAEMRATHGIQGSRQRDEWDGQPPNTSTSAEAWHDHSQGYLARSNISASTSSPSILSLSSDGTVTTKDKYGQSPPPTSTSFSSFQTFGGSQAQKQPRSYGFSGGSGMRDDTYLRKVASSKNLSGSVSSRKSGKSVHSNDLASPVTQATPLPLASHLPLNDDQEDKEITFQQSGNKDHSAASSNAVSASTSSSNLQFPPLPDTPDAQAHSSGSWSKRAKRQSHLAALSTSQQKRISRALLEIDHELRRDGSATQISKPAIQEEEEVLEPEQGSAEDAKDDGGHTPASSHERRPSYPGSERSVQSQHSAPFPYGMSPARSEKTVVESPSPSGRLPPSPRYHNLKAQVGPSTTTTTDPQDDIPPLNLTRKPTGRSPDHRLTPIVAPARTQPIRHKPSPSMSPSAVSPVPGYIPGQPRPVGSFHRSDGSVSSRSATPTNQTPTTTAPTSAQSNGSIKGHLRAGSTPLYQQPPIASRSSSLGRSQSVNQGPGARYDNDESLSKGSLSYGQNLGNAHLTLDRDAPTSRRPSSLLSVTSPPIIEDEAEDAPHDFTDNGPDSLRNQPTPDIRVIPQRKEMAQAPNEQQLQPEETGDALGWNLKSGKSHASRVVSEEGFIDGPTESEIAPSSALMPNAQILPVSLEGWQRTVREAASRQSLSSDYANDEASDAVWDDLFATHNRSSEELQPRTPASAAAVSDALRKLSGIGKEEMAVLQDRLVSKAKAERQAIRDDSPSTRHTPTMQPASSLPKRSASLARGHSPLPPSHLSPELPPSAWRRPSVERVTPSPAPSSHPIAPKLLAGLFTPPSTATATTPAKVVPTESLGNMNAVVVDPGPPPLQTPSAEGHDEIVYTPLSDPLSRNTSSAAANREFVKLPLEEDPEVRKDFEARIAAATAALNRAPSQGGTKLERRTTKKGAAIVISSPKLVSSSSNVTGTPLTPPESSIDPAMRKALDKTSGTTGGKSTGRWRKLGFRRGPSLSSQTTAESPSSPPPPTPPMASIAPTLGATPTTEKKLEEAIKLPAGAAISPDLDNFKFPPLANRSVKNPALRDRPISPPMPYQPAMQQVVQPQTQPQPPSMAVRVDPDRAPHSGSSAATATVPHPPVFNAMEQPMSAVPQSARSGTHSHTSSSDSAVAKFVESGRALGLNQEQLDQMLAANGMLDRSATTASSRSYQSTAPTTTSFSQSGHSHTRSDSQTKQVTRKPSVSTKSEDKSKGGLFRSFSKSKRTKTKGDSPDPNLSEKSEPVPVDRNVVVRRTILVPHGDVKIPTTPTMVKTPSTVAESPDMSRLGAGTGRKQSIKRKPLNLTREDHELVSSSPPSHRRNFSTGTTYSNRSDGQPDSGPVIVNKGLGFLHPLGNSARSIGGAGSSLTGISESPSDGRRRSSDSRRRSSTGGSLYDLYGDDSTGQDSQEFLKPEATPERRDSDEASRHSASQNPAVEICEYADGRVVWAVVDGLRDDDDLPNADYSTSSHSRNDSFTSNGSSSQNERNGPWPGGKANYNTPALNFRHRDRGLADQPRPETFVYRADTRDVADLIDHLSRDQDPSKDNSRGRIDFSHLGSGTGDGGFTPQSSPFPYSTTQSRQGDEQPSPDPRFADPPSPEPTAARHRTTTNGSPHRSPPPPPIYAPPPSAQVPAGGFSPKRQMMLRQGFGAHRANVHLGSTIGKGSSSPGGVSFSSSNSGGRERTVEERLQDLLDRLKRQNEQDASQGRGGR